MQITANTQTTAANINALSNDLNGIDLCPYNQRYENMDITTTEDKLPMKPPAPTAFSFTGKSVTLFLIEKHTKIQVITFAEAVRLQVRSPAVKNHSNPKLPY